jgi:hypothetical protein
MSRRTLSDTLNVTLMDSGDLTQISGHERESVELVVSQLVQLGLRVVSPPRVDGAMWTATCRRLEIPGDAVQIERLGRRLFIRSRSLERARSKVAELSEGGARPEGEIFRIGAFYTAVLYDPSGCVSPGRSA